MQIPFFFGQVSWVFEIQHKKQYPVTMFWNRRSQLAHIYMHGTQFLTNTSFVFGKLESTAARDPVFKKFSRLVEISY